jgi:uncharacterized damage-inducible protein DinB
MYSTIADFVEDWGRETAISLKVERALTDASLSQRSDPEGNTLERIAWHMVLMIGGHGAALGLEVKAPPRGTEPPGTAVAIADAYDTAARSMGAGVVVPSIYGPSRGESAELRARQKG